MTGTEDTILHQYGALPVSVTEHGKVRVLLVTTRGRQNWIIPKGWPIEKLTASDTAAREAYEEAGLLGSVVGEAPIGLYRYQKRGNSRKPATHEVSVFLFAVERQLRKWPEKAERVTRWFAPAEASSLVTPVGLAEILKGINRFLPAHDSPLWDRARISEGRGYSGGSPIGMLPENAPLPGSTGR